MENLKLSRECPCLSTYLGPIWDVKRCEECLREQGLPKALLTSLMFSDAPRKIKEMVKFYLDWIERTGGIKRNDQVLNDIIRKNSQK